MKRIIAFLLVIGMVLNFAACGAPAQQTQKNDPNNLTLQVGEENEMDRQDKELVAELIGGLDASDMTDEELDALVDQLVGESESSSGVVNLVDKQTKPEVEYTQDPDAYDEEGAMTEPFDQVYPELIEKEQVSFSGESILVKLSSGKLTGGLKAAGIGGLEEIVPMEKASWYEAKLTEGTDPKAALAAVRQLSEVLLAEYNYEVETAALDDYKHFDKDKDEEFKKNGHNKDQWHFHHCGIPDGYDKMETEGGDKSVIVAVIDSGVDYTHEDLKDNMWVNTGEIPDNGTDDDGNGYIDDYYGVDIITGTGSGDDTNGHGTHVAGIIAARNNNTGVLGIAYNTEIMSVKAANHSGMLNQADIAKAVLYAYNHGAEVINMSFGGITCSIAVQDALATAYTRCVLVASAGNNGKQNEFGFNPLPNYPAALTYVLGVMSVGETGIESPFTNYDMVAFNGVEYEVYAPGENIMSTLPGNQYGYLSGTSMAAPVVSAFAAILRSEYSDRTKYPTKFIYGQLASTSDYYATCCHPGVQHNLPQIVNLHAALTKLPKPEVSPQDYRLFDDPKYSEKNNGDGVIDAGETVALGLTLRNRWGMSENTLVTIDTKSSVSGLADPYITIHNPTVNYGSVGTYSTQDCGKVWTDELWTGWEDPFLITISEDCPNDYQFTLNITIACENALDEADQEVYITKGNMFEAVRAGFILPSIIEEDMVLTKENLYIIPNGTLIKEGVTVRVEPGTHIQFWTDDPNDTYAATYIAYLLVNGNFLVEGTKEDPVYIYPSQLMDAYNVEIAEGSTGYISMKYADITNLGYISQSNTGRGNRISMADHCTFRLNYGHLYQRYISGGNVYLRKFPQNSGTSILGEITAKDSVFYKLAGFYRDENGYIYTGKVVLNGATVDRCIFTECGINHQGGLYNNCVFLKNSYQDQTAPDIYVNSSKNANYTYGFGTVRAVAYRPETGSTYLAADDTYVQMREYLAQLGAKPMVIETEDELQWLWKNFAHSYTWGLKTKYDEEIGIHVWSDGTPITTLPDPDGKIAKMGRKDKLALAFSETYMALYVNYGTYTLYEMPGQILPEEITFQRYLVDIDPDTTFQLAPLSKPAQLPADGFLYESSDNTVLTVSDTGLVTPVGKGTADVWVYSLDKAVKNRVTFTVRDYVPLESISVAAAMEIPVGEFRNADVAVLPADTTRSKLTFRSSDEMVATVDTAGNILGISSGKATVTVTCEGMEASIQVTVYQKTKELKLGSLTMAASLESDAIPLPKVITDEGAEPILSWRSTDETVATVKAGEIIPQKNGTTALVVTDSRSGLSASCLVIVQEGTASPVKQMAFTSYMHLALLENGDLYCWYPQFYDVPACVLTGVEHVAISANSYTGTFAAVLEDGTIQVLSIYEQWSENERNLYVGVDASCDFFEGDTVAEFEFAYDGRCSFYVRTTQGNCYAWGDSNDYGQLGVGSRSVEETPLLINLDGVVDMSPFANNIMLLTENGELYGAGEMTGSPDPVLLDTEIARIVGVNGDALWYLKTDGTYMTLRSYSTIPDLQGEYPALLDMDAVILNGYDTGNLAMKDGKLYRISPSYTNEPMQELPGVTDAVALFAKNSTVYIATAGGMLYGLGRNVDGSFAGMTTATIVTEPLLIPLKPLAEETVTVAETDLTDGQLIGESLTVSFSKALTQASPKLYADGIQVTVLNSITDVNRLEISRSAGFTEGVSYELVFEPGALHGSGGVVNTQEIRIAFTYAEAEEEAPEVPVTYESILDESIERILTAEKLNDMIKAYQDEYKIHPEFYGNAVLNPISTDDVVEHWLRIMTPSSGAGNYQEVYIGGNYWGSTNTRAIELQMIDYTDFANYARLVYSPYLETAPENTFPFVTAVKLFNKYGEEVKTVSNEQVTFRVTFNRDMDTSIPLTVRFGSAYPYGDYEIEGKYVDARTWEGTYTLNTIIENGNQFFTIENGCSATEDLGLQLDRGRFGFVIDTTAAQALIMQGTATDTGIQLKWTQDDFDTLMGYNVYRATSEDGLYTRLNKTVIPADTMEWFDDTVEPGKVYYYNFTVVQTDMAESEPSGKIAIMSKDTMAPNIYHSPVASAFTGANLVLSATVTDNLSIAYANLYYRVAGTEGWSIVRMNKLNDQYSAIIPAAYITVEGLEYYIEAFDGVSYTYKGTANAPYTVAVQEAIDANALGDVDGDGVITNLDALKLLYAINDKYNMTTEEFARADLNGDGELWAAEALRILQYVSGAVGSVKM